MFLMEAIGLVFMVFLAAATGLELLLFLATQAGLEEDLLGLSAVFSIVYLDVHWLGSLALTNADFYDRPNFPGFSHELLSIFWHDDGKIIKNNRIFSTMLLRMF